ncbi:peptidoglycan-binding protein [Spirulina major]|uniref:peptidoglycan-binding protein n=1 Tax=Spirulina major TaxID=270636 RepID=UPI000933E429|nr:peptidoglycan-binding protein [Spirulina major]
MDALAYTHSYASHEANTGIEYDFSEVDFFEWAKAPSAPWLKLLAVGVLVASISAIAPVAIAHTQVDTPSGRCLNARTGPSTQYTVATCVTEGATLKPVIETKGDWLKLSSGRWVYGPYTTYGKATPPAMATGNRLRQVNTPKNSCLNARTGPGIQYAAAMCVRDGAPLKAVTQIQGDWLQLSSGRWVYGPYTAPIAAAPPANTGGRTVLLMGSRGDTVKAVQTKLVELKYGIGPAGIDSIYGPDTKSAVSAFQKANGLTVDGIVGPATIAKMGL